MDQSMNLKKITEELSAPEVFAEYQGKVETLDAPFLRLGVLGQPNTGKTSFINTVLETDLKVSSLPSDTDYVVGYAEKPASSTDNGTTEIDTPSPLLKAHNVKVIERTLDFVPEMVTPIQLGEVLAGFDICVYMLNAQAPLNRTDVFTLSNMDELGMKVLVVPSRMDLIDEGGKADLLSYIKATTDKLHNISISSISGAIHDDRGLLQKETSHLIEQCDTKEQRNEFRKLFATVCVGKLYSLCQNKIDACEKQKEDVSKRFETKQKDLDAKELAWLTVETQLRKRLFDISDKLRAGLAAKKDEMLRRLNHDVDMAGDVKTFWEKDFSFRFEEYLRAQTLSFTQLVNQEIVKTIQWLQAELLKQFHCKITFTTSTIDASSKPGVGTDDVQVADMQRLKIVTRIGTAATVIGAGTLLATSGVAGIVMGVSILSGLGAEFFMRHKANESKEAIKQHLPGMVDKAYLEVVMNFEKKLQNVTDELVAHLQTLKADWVADSHKNLEKEKEIATFNGNPAKWDGIMQEINQVSEQIIK